MRNPELGPSPRRTDVRYYSYPSQRSKTDELADVCDGLLRDYPSLGGDDGVRQLISALPSV